MKRVFGAAEAIFDIVYLMAGALIGILLAMGADGNYPRLLSGIMALFLIGGDFFHLLPRVKAVISGDEEKSRPSIGRGKQISSITMTIFYLFLWHIGLLAFSPQNVSGFSYTIYLLAIVRIALCLLPQNKWEERYPPVRWGVLRNIPFFLIGIMVAALYFFCGNPWEAPGMVWIAVILSFLFYFPVVLWVNKNPKIGMLMLPKTLVYLWLLTIFLTL